jgi:hypothetical protein
LGAVLAKLLARRDLAAEWSHCDGVIVADPLSPSGRSVATVVRVLVVDHFAMFATNSKRGRR